MGKSFFFYSALLHLRIPGLLGDLCTSHPRTDLPWKGFPYDSLTDPWTELSPSQNCRTLCKGGQGITQEKSYCFSRMLKTSKCEVMGIAEGFINPFSPEYHEQVKGAGEGMVFTWERSNTWLFIGWSQICSALIARQFKSCEKNAVQRRKKIQEGREEGKSKNKKSRSKEDYSSLKKNLLSAQWPGERQR